MEFNKYELYGQWCYVVEKQKQVVVIILIIYGFYVGEKSDC